MGYFRPKGWVGRPQVHHATPYYPSDGRSGLKTLRMRIGEITHRHRPLERSAIVSLSNLRVTRFVRATDSHTPEATRRGTVNLVKLR